MLLIDNVLFMQSLSDNSP